MSMRSRGRLGVIIMIIARTMISTHTHTHVSTVAHRYRASMSAPESTTPPRGGPRRVSLLDYGAGNVRSVRNAITALGYEVHDITSPEEIEAAEVIVFPGVGSFGSAMEVLNSKGFADPLRAYIRADRPFFGICLGMQTLFEGSEECPGVAGLGIIKGTIKRFDSSAQLSVPHIGWNGLLMQKHTKIIRAIRPEELVYFVHSYRAIPSPEAAPWALTLTTYGANFISAVQQGRVMATQFHPEKSGTTGLRILKTFLDNLGNIEEAEADGLWRPIAETRVSKRVIACLDVRSNDEGDLVVTKGDQYDVRERADGEGGESSNGDGGRGAVRNLGKPVALAKRYYDEGADEVTFLNITSFRQGVIDDLPMLQVLEKASEQVFVPLTVGGGIRGYTEPGEGGRTFSALEVAARYFRAGADKVSIGSDAVTAAEEVVNSGGKLTGASAIEQISHRYGRQAVVVSIDPRRVYLAGPEACPEGHTAVELPEPAGPNGERWCWYQATIKGGREGRPIDAVRLARVCQELGAGEILLNCVDMDGQCQGYDLALVRAVRGAVTIPVIASSGAGSPQHFSEVFNRTGVEAALAAGIFHRREVEIAAVKAHLKEVGIPVRIVVPDP